MQCRVFDLIPGSERSPGEGKGYPLQYSWASLMTQLVKKPPAIWETWVRSLGWEDPLEKGRLPTPVFRPGEFHGLYSPWGRKESDTTERLSLSTVFLRFILVVACISTSCFFFLLLDSNLPYEYITLFIHSSVGFMSLRHTPKNRIAGSYDNYAL